MNGINDTAHPSIAGVFNTTTHTGTGTGFDSYALVASGLRIGLADYCDITGTGTGQSGKVKINDVWMTPRKALPLGIGKDEEQKRAQWLADWLDGKDGGNVAQRASIHARIADDNMQGNRLADIGKTAARRAAQRIADMRGIVASDTSKQDAASDAVIAVLQHVRRLDKLTAAQWESARVRRVLHLYANRAAFLSLSSWGQVGITGDNTGAARFDKSTVVELTTELAQSLKAQDTIEKEGITPADRRARWAAVRWVFAIGFTQFAAQLPADMRGAARAASLRYARQRCLAIASMILGASMDEATRHAGFQSIKSFAQSCKEANLFEDLKAARAASIADSGHIEQARIAMRHHALQVKHTWQALQAMPSAIDFDGTRNAHLFTLRPSFSKERKQLVIKDTARAVLASCHLARVQLARRYNQGLKLAIHYRNVTARHRSAMLAAFDKVFLRRAKDTSNGESLPFESLRHATGLEDSLGRTTHASKQDGATIRAPRGKVSRARRSNDTTALQVGKRKRSMPCARLAPANVQDIGAQLAASWMPVLTA